MRSVSAGTYVSVGITVALAGLAFIGITTNIVLGLTFIAVGLLCLIGGAYEWYLREGTAAPDVHLEFSLPNTLSAQNAGAPATEIQVEPLTTGDYVHGYLDRQHIPGRGNVSGAIVRKALDVVFGVISDLYDSTPRAVPFVVRDTTPGVLLVRPNLTMQDFLQAAIERRKTEELQHLQDRRGAPLSPAEIESAARHLGRPVEIHLRVTYWDRAKSRQWEKRERLRYEPQTKHAYIIHGKRHRKKAG